MSYASIVRRVDMQVSFYSLAFTIFFAFTLYVLPTIKLFKLYQASVTCVLCVGSLEQLIHRSRYS